MENEESAQRQARAIELGLVMYVTVLPLILQSILGSLYGQEFLSLISYPIYILTASVRLIGGIALVAYVLARTGRTFRAIGLGLQWRDIGDAIGLFVLASVAYCIGYSLIGWLARIVTGAWVDTQARNVEFIHS